MRHSEYDHIITGYLDIIKDISDRALKQNIIVPDFHA